MSPRVNVQIVVPRRADNGERDGLWDFARRRWEADFPDWPVREGHHNHGPFNRSAAINKVVHELGDWDVLLVIDADVLANRDAVTAAVDIAHATGRIVLPYSERVHINKSGTAKVLAGYDGPWRVRQMVEAIYTKQDSCVVAVPRSAWVAVGGFDELFIDWFGEDTAFNIAAETLTGKPLVRLDGELFHLHHTKAAGTAKGSPTRIANAGRLDAYKAAAGDADAIRRLLDEPNHPLELEPTRIPRILHRTIPEHTGDQIEGWWLEFGRLHRGWQLRTYRDPLDPADWPATADLWARCKNGAQRAGLIRLEALVRDGGVYVDSDVQPFLSFEPLVQLPAFAGWEDDHCVPDAVLGCEPNHPAFVTALQKARAVIEGGGDAWHSGPGVTTETLPGRDDVLLLPPGAFYEIHYLDKARLGDPPKPHEFARHMWHGSWLTPAQRKSIERRQHS